MIHWLFAVVATQGGFRIPPTAKPQSKPPVVEYSFKDLASGSSPPLGPKDRVTISFAVVDAKGKELANTERRGMLYTFVLGEGTEPLLDRVATGMSVGGERTATCSAELIYGQDAIGEVVARKAVVTITLKVVSAVKATSGRQ